MLGGPIVDDAVLRRIGDSIAHRGPDDYGAWRDDSAEVALVHRRLAILDLSSSGKQPMSSNSGRYILAYNGEIYNHKDLRKKLPDLGWRGHSDTETLLAGFEAWGIQETVERLVGMFAFAVWDRKSSSLTLVRDRLGEKPLYWGRQGKTLLFGSELKALKKHPAFCASIDRDSLAEYMRYGYIPAPRSIYMGIQKLEPGCICRVSIGEEITPKIARYWSLVEVARNGIMRPDNRGESEILIELEEKLVESVQLQQISDVPIGAFLSGGVDSSTIVALMQAQGSSPVSTFTIGFHDGGYNEAEYARSVADYLGTNHTELYVSSDQARAVIPDLSDIYDEPFADSSQIPTFLVSKLARERVSVALSGDGGDELFGGYNRYIWARKLLRLPAAARRIAARGLNLLTPGQWDRLCEVMAPVLPSFLKIGMPSDRAQKLATVLGAGSDSAIYRQMVSMWDRPDKLVIGGHDSDVLEKKWSELSEFCRSENCMMALDFLTYLPDDILCKVDRAAMRVSLEVRVPFLDHRVVEYAWQLPLSMKIRGGEGKWILRRLLCSHVPNELIDRPKMGFGVPIGHWLRGPLREWAEELLDEYRLRAEGYLDPVPIRKRWEEHLNERRNWQYQLWNVLMFQAWHLAQR